MKETKKQQRIGLMEKRILVAMAGFEFPLGVKSPGAPSERRNRSGI
jgi:hypothetical protein